MVRPFHRPEKLTIVVVYNGNSGYDGEGSPLKMTLIQPRNSQLTGLITIVSTVVRGQHE